MKKNIIFLIQKMLHKNPLFFIKLKKLVRYPAEHLYKTLNVIQVLSREYLKNIDESAIIIDVGAYDGATCLFWSKFFPNIKIIGFEPNIEMYQIMRKNCEKNNHIIIYNVGIGSKKYTTKFYVTNNTASSSIYAAHSKYPEFKIEKQFEVEIIPLDEIHEVQNSSTVVLIKIDVQGSESEVLLGAPKTLSKTAVVLVEMGNHSIYQSANYFNVDTLLRENGFELYDIIPSLYGYDFAHCNELEKNKLMEWDAIYINKKLFNKLNT